MLEQIPHDARAPFVSFVQTTGNPHRRGQTPLHAAAKAGHPQLVRLLLDSGSDKEARRCDLFTPLFIAAKSGHLSVVETLLAAGADVHAALHTRATALCVAASKGRLQVVEALLRAGADKNSALIDGRSALFIASYSGYLSIVTLLLGCGADPSAANSLGFNALLAASQEGHREVVSALLGAGVEVDHCDHLRYSALHLACVGRRTHAVELLLAAGADRNCVTKDGATPLWMICRLPRVQRKGGCRRAKKEQKRIVKDQRHAERDPRAWVAKDYRIIAMLLASGADPNKPAKNGSIPLDMVDRHRAPELAELFESVPLKLQTLCQMQIRLQEVRSAIQSKNHETMKKILL